MPVAESARLSFSANPDNLENDDYVSVQFSTDGINFVEIDRITGDGGTENLSFNLTGPFTANAAIRFVATSFENGFLGIGSDVVQIDNVTVDFFRPAPVPTVNYETTFTEDQNEVAIANNPGIVEDSGELVSARIVLTNAQAGDVLTAPTDLPGNIDPHHRHLGARPDHVILTGAESIANYQAAIQAIRFANTSQNPSSVDRIIQVTVNDGFLNSNVATTTVNVVPVNDAPAANNDSVYTNYTTAPFILPEWALLANDTDGEGAALDVTTINAVSGLTASLTTGSVTVTDTGTAGGNFTYTANDGSGAANATDTATVTITRDTTGAINGNDSDNILIGDGGNSTLTGGQGDDLVFAGAGNDTITWGVTTLLRLRDRQRRPRLRRRRCRHPRPLRRHGQQRGRGLRGLCPRLRPGGARCRPQAGHGDRDHPQREHHRRARQHRGDHHQHQRRCNDTCRPSATSIPPA